jgi:hypothetical protein
MQASRLAETEAMVQQPALAEAVSLMQAAVAVVHTPMAALLEQVVLVEELMV